jgi:hypothetical protein
MSTGGCALAMPGFDTSVGDVALPHAAQNLASSGLGTLQCGQFTVRE